MLSDIGLCVRLRSLSQRQHYSCSGMFAILLARIRRVLANFCELSQLSYRYTGRYIQRKLGAQIMQHYKHNAYVNTTAEKL